MSQDAENIKLMPIASDLLDALRQTYRAWNEGGPSAMARGVWHPEIAWHDPPDFPDSTVRRGADVVARHLSARLEALGDTTVTLKNAWQVGEGDVVLAELALHSGGQSSGMRLDVPLFHVARLSGGRAIEVWEYMRREQALEALGLSEQDAHAES
jgi:ketosteroid isomerase-like protein